jgi:hypothetical protein
MGICVEARATYTSISRYIWHDKHVSPDIQGISSSRKVRACWCQAVPSISVPVSGNDHEDVCHVANRHIPIKRQCMSPQNVCEARYDVTWPLWLLPETALNEKLVLGLYETPFHTSQSTGCGGVKLDFFRMHFTHCKVSH